MAKRRKVTRRPSRPRARPPRVAPFEGIRTFYRRKIEENPELFQHLANSRIEFWRAVRSLVDWRINTLEGRRERMGKRGVTRVKVTE